MDVERMSFSLCGLIRRCFQRGGARGCAREEYKLGFSDEPRSLAASHCAHGTHMREKFWTRFISFADFGMGFRRSVHTNTYTFVVNIYDFEF